MHRKYDDPQLDTLYNRHKMRSHEFKRIRKVFGGGYSFFEALKMSRTGSPLAYYESGQSEITELNDRCNDLLRVNIERLKKGYFIWFAERTNRYFYAIPDGALSITHDRSEKEWHYGRILAVNINIAIKYHEHDRKGWEQIRQLISA